MISQELFVKTMERLEKLDHNMGALDNAMHALCPGFGGFYIPEAVDVTMEVLKEIFNDKDEWIEYCAYELDYLAKYENGTVTWEDGSPIDLSAWENVYDFLIKYFAED